MRVFQRAAREIWVSEASRVDWPYFAGWHYRSHDVGFVQYVTLLWHKEEPIGICVFCTPALSLGLRRKFFGLSGRRSKLSCRALNRQLVTLSRVVIVPKYRGAGLASRFVRLSCESCQWAWIEAVAEMGKVNPFFERAGFQRVGSMKVHKNRSSKKHAGIYGTKPGTNQSVKLSAESHRKSEYAEPEYFVFDNRGRGQW